MLLPETDLESIAELEDILSEVERALSRYKNLGEPRLKKATGPWISIDNF